MTDTLYTSVDDLPLTRKDVEKRLEAIVDMTVGIKKLVESESARWADMDINSVMKITLVCADEIKREAEALWPLFEGGKS